MGTNVGKLIGNLRMFKLCPLIVFDSIISPGRSIVHCVSTETYPRGAVGCTSDSSKAPVVSLSKKLYPYCLVLVGSRNRFERGFTIKLKQIEGLMKDWLKCQLSPLVKYRQNKNTIRSLCRDTYWDMIM